MTDTSPLVQPRSDNALTGSPELIKLDAAPVPPMVDTTIRTSLETTQGKKDYALITGASSGIGEAFARLLASKNKPLILIGTNEVKLKNISAELREKHKVDVRFIPTDLARSKTLPELPVKLKKMGINVDILVNSAGFGKYDAEHKIRYEDSLNMINLNCRSLVALTKLFLPEMLAHKKGAIINIGSTSGFYPVPYMATYSATKAFVINFSQALSEEVKDQGIRVICSCPEAVATNFQRRAGLNIAEQTNLNKLIDPSTVAEQTIEALKKGKTLLVLNQSSPINKLAPTIAPRAILNRYGKQLLKKTN